VGYSVSLSAGGEVDGWPHDRGTRLERRIDRRYLYFWKRINNLTIKDKSDEEFGLSLFITDTPHNHKALMKNLSTY
jgi:hypothetical protein